jgi:membrane-associated phospholipid phosphatase
LRCTRAGTLLLVAALAWPRAAAADPVQVDWSDDVPATVTLLAAWLALSALQDEIVGHDCGWCGGPGPVDRAVRRALIAPSPKAANTASNVMLYAAVPVFSLAVSLITTRVAGDSWIVLAEDVTIVAESFALASLVTGLVKIAARRTRPYLHYGGGDPLYRDGSLDVTGFVSGHSSMAASVAASTATLAFLRGRPSAPWIAVAGGAVAVTTGMLRIAADRHYLSDVLAGLVLSTAVGILVPVLHVLPPGRGGDVALAICPSPGGLGVSGTF